MLFILGLALLIFGPAQLPKIGRQIGKALADFKRASNDFKNQLDEEVRKMELDQMREEARKMKEEAKNAIMLEPAPNTVAQGAPAETSAAAAAPASTPAAAPEEPIEFSKLSHTPEWEERNRKIQPPAQPAAPKATGE